MIATGFLTDRVGRKPILLLACILGFVGAVPIFLLLNQPSALSAQLGQLGLVAMIGLYGGTLPVFMVEAAPLPVRCTAVALGYNITFGVIGGFTPLVAAWLVDRSGDEIAPAFLIMAAAAVTFLDGIAISRDVSQPVHYCEFGRGPGLRVSASAPCSPQSRSAACAGVNFSFSASATARWVILPSHTLRPLRRCSSSPSARR